VTERISGVGWGEGTPPKLDLLLRLRGVGTISRKERLSGKQISSEDFLVLPHLASLALGERQNWLAIH